MYLGTHTHGGTKATFCVCPRRRRARRHSASASAAATAIARTHDRGNCLSLLSRGASEAIARDSRAMPTAKELLALEDRFESLSDAQKRCVIKVQARLRGWAQRHKSRQHLIRDAAVKGGVWAQFSLSTTETLVETYRAHVGGPVASGTGDLYVTDKRLCFYCESSDPKMRDGILFSPSKPKRGTSSPISLKIAYKEIKAITTKAEYVSEPGVVLEMRDGSSMWFGGFYFTSSVKALIENEWTRETVAKLNHAQALRTQILMSTSRASGAAAHERVEALKEELDLSRTKLERANAREREHVLEIEILRENEERLERQKKKLANQARDLEEDIEAARLKQTAALTAQRAAEKKLSEIEVTFEAKIDALLEEKNMTIEEMSKEVNNFKSMLSDERATMKADVERARKLASDLRDQRDALMTEKAKLTIQLGQLETELASRPEVDDSIAEERIAELEAALEAFNAEKEKNAASMASLSAKHNSALSEITNLRAELATRADVVSTKKVDDARVAELEAALEAFNAEKEKNAASMASLSAKHNSALSEITNLRAELATRADVVSTKKVDDARVAELEAALEAFNAEKEKNAASMASLSAKHNSALSEITNLRAELATRADVVSTKKVDDARVAELEAALETTRAEQKSSAAAMADMKSKHNAALAEIANLRAQSDHVSTVQASELEALQSKYEAAVNALTAARNEKDQAMKKCDDLAKRDAEAGKQITGKNTKIKAMEVELDALRDTRESSSAALAALTAKYEEAQKQLCALHSEKADLTKRSSAELQHREGKLREELGLAKAKCDELLHEIDALRLQREESRVAMATLESKYQEAAGNLQDLKTRHAADLAKFDQERKVLECALTESKESNNAALAAVQNERESMRSAKEQQNVSMVALKAKYENVGKQLESTKSELANAISAREKALEEVHLAKQSEEKAKSQMLAHEKSLFQAEADVSAAQIQAAAAISSAKSAEKRENVIKTELQELRRQNEALLKDHSTLEARSTQLEEKAQMLVKVEQEMAALRAELQVTALQQEKWKQDVAYAKAEIERSRTKAEADGEKFSELLKNMSEAEREAASARAAESVARDYASRSNESAKEVQARELRMREELTTMRVAYEKLSTDFRAKTEEFSREVSRLEKAVSDEQNKVNVIQLKLEEAQKTVQTLEQANIHSHNKIGTLKDTLRRQKQETDQLYTEYQNVCANLDETKMLLEREQSATADMHRQKMMEKSRSSSMPGYRAGLPGAASISTRSPLGSANCNPRLGLPSIEQLLPALGPIKPALGSPPIANTVD